MSVSARLTALAALCAIAFAPCAANSKERTDAEVRQTGLDFANCVIKDHGTLATEVLLLNISANQIVKDYRRLIDFDCLPNNADKISFGTDLFRYFLADALVNAEFAADGPKDFTDRLALEHLAAPTESELKADLASAKSPKRRAQIEEQYRKSSGVGALSRYGECVVRHDPANSRGWILAKPGTAEEASRIGALRPSFSDCLTGTISFSKASMRGTVALNYYRLAHARVQPPGKTN